MIALLVVLSLSLIVVIEKGSFFLIKENDKKAGQAYPFSSVFKTAQASSNTKQNPTFPTPSIRMGLDWALPDNVRVEPYSGFIDEYGGDPAYVHNVFVMSRWDEINPARNSFDFSSLDAELKQANEKDRKLLIRLEVNSACEAPKWALEILRSTRKKSLVFWDKQYSELLSPLLYAFAKRYASHPRIAGVQLGIGDGEYNGSCKDFSKKEGWGEFWMRPAELVEAEQQFGLTPALFFKRSKEIIDLYAKAFAGFEGKLAYTNAEPYFSWTKRAEPYNKIMYQLADYVLAKGIGNRDGQIEHWMRYVDKAFGMKFDSMGDATCRLEMDERFARKIKGRYWGTENEFYGNKDYVLAEHGPYRNHPYRFFVSSLRSLQMRRNFISITGRDMRKLDDPVYKTQDFMYYLSKTMGKQINNTPDIFVLLGERYIRKSRLSEHTHESCVKGDKVAVRSFGRWLKETSNSTPAMRVDMPGHEEYWGQDFYLPEGIDYEYAARSARRFDFDVNDELAKTRCKNACLAEIKISFKDTVKTSLVVTVAEGRTEAIRTHADGNIKTASFKLESKFNNQLQGVDFIVSSKDKPIPVMLVRMNILKDKL